LKPLFIACLICWPALARADADTYTTSDGRVFMFAGADEDGVLYPDTDPTDAYTMNFDCTVTHDTLGAGEWHFANGGWVIEFDGQVKLGFPRQAPPMDVQACAF
jgi:hypothetical protein